MNMLKKLVQDRRRSERGLDKMAETEQIIYRAKGEVVCYVCELETIRQSRCQVMLCAIICLREAIQVETNSNGRSEVRWQPHIKVFLELRLRWQ